MRKTIIKSIIHLFVLLFALIYVSSAFAEESRSSFWVPKIFGNNMVLQRGVKIPIWGKSIPNDKIKVILGKSKVTAQADKEGKWKVNLDPLTAGGPYTMTIYGKETVTFENVLIGEVWVGSGQSNMEMPVGGWGKVINYQKVIEEANNPNIRLLIVDRTVSPKPLDDVQTKGWRSCDSTSVEYFSAVGYFFVKELQNKLNCPIGIIQSAWGGTKVQAWISDEGVEKVQELKDRKQKMEPTPVDFKAAVKDYDIKTSQWQQKVIEEDAAYKDGKWIFQNISLDTRDWKTMQLPQAWEDAGYPSLDGAVWFRKEVKVPDSWKGKDLTIHLGAIDDQDITWFNGEKIGQTNWFLTARNYKIPGSLVKEGNNLIAVRVLDMGGAGGFSGTTENFKITLADSDSTSNEFISLSGDWSYKIGFDLYKVTPMPAYPYYPPWCSSLYNGMIAPLEPYAIRGVIWYQGESDAAEANIYRKSFPNLIMDWRNHWNQGEFPFLFVQLANYTEQKPEPVDEDWAYLRESQSMTLSVPNTGMAVAIDIGDTKDIHPKNKQEVGRRLSLAALKSVYKEKLVSSGPMYSSMTIQGNNIKITFKSTGSGLMAKEGDTLKGFAVAGKDKKFYWANAVIEGSNVIVSSGNVLEPIAVRYAWASNPVCNLYNKEGLPAVPFRTDNWNRK